MSVARWANSRVLCWYAIVECFKPPHGQFYLHCCSGFSGDVCAPPCHNQPVGAELDLSPAPGRLHRPPRTRLRRPLARQTHIAVHIQPKQVSCGAAEGDDHILPEGGGRQPQLHRILMANKGIFSSLARLEQLLRLFEALLFFLVSLSKRWER